MEADGRRSCGWRHLDHASLGATSVVESFNSRVRDECLNINRFWSLAQARVVISGWKAG